MGHQISHLKINFVLLSALVWIECVFNYSTVSEAFFPIHVKGKKKLLGKLNREGPVVQKVDNAIHRIN